ncbi:hypothetical protein H6P81_019375 [Aristolochia fimbriata]|uniref:Trans-resveratrol di-O-methyltransferase n=1 Tax=Aristolochia fimbriata TaxID=158543 RepID=A0AAV7DT24_ARIFI|nr:hypothetical protein H6P81_019375 [Aristolochia fimbriata]
MASREDGPPGSDALLWNHIFSYANSMSLKCAVELGIPNIVHKHGKPISLFDLVAAIPVPVEKTDHLRRLMRLLVHNGMFSVPTSEGKEESYALTPSSRLLVGDGTHCLSPFLLMMLDPSMQNPWLHFSRWFKEQVVVPGSGTRTRTISKSPFQICHGMELWEYAKKNPDFTFRFNEAMESDSRFLMSTLVTEYASVFDGLNSVVDVGGGTGGAARALVKAFPHLKLTVLELPHVVAGLPANSVIDFVAGDMFQWIPPGDAVFLKWVLHDWSDEDCVKILRKCKEAISAKEKGTGKVIIVDMVVNSKGEDEHTFAQTQFLFDLLMNVVTTGKERTEEEWKKLFDDAGFSRYTIALAPVPGLRSVIQEMASREDGPPGSDALLWNHIFSYANSMSLKCAVELGIPNIIQKHGKPISLSDLVAAIPVSVEKTNHLRRLMRLLVHNGMFSVPTSEGKEESYALTPSSRLLVGDGTHCLSPFLLMMLDPSVQNPWLHFSRWFKEQVVVPGSGTRTRTISKSPFQICHGMELWEYAKKNPDFTFRFNEAMESDSRFLMSTLVTEYAPVFNGLNSVVDVGGGTGGAARALVKAFPHLKLTVLELPHVVAGLPANSVIDFVAGDMFQWIPPGDAVFLKWVLHDWSDEDCVKILRKCKEAISAKEKGTGKVIIVDMVVNSKGADEHTFAQTQFLFDLLMNVVTTGKQRTEEEWKKIFDEAGFSRYTIAPVPGLRSVIQVFP